MDRAEYIKCILKGPKSPGKAGKSWCGRDIWSHEWVFLDIDHAMSSETFGSRLVSCPDCLRQSQVVLSGR